MTAKMFIHSKHTNGYEVKNISAEDSIDLNVNFNEYGSSASFLLGTCYSISFCELLYSFYISSLFSL